MGTDQRGPVMVSGDVVSDGPSGFAARLKRLRVEAGLSQTQLAGEDLSPSYISLLESGKRQPSLQMVEHLAKRLGCSSSMLWEGAASERERRISLELAYARLAITHGEADDARFRLTQLLGESDLDQRSADEATLLLARTAEQRGELGDAIATLLPLFARSRSGASHVPLTTVGPALFLYYTDSGDLHQAVAVGETVFAAIVDRGLTGTEDYYRVASGLIFAYYELGDLSHAMAWARQLIQETESAGSRKGQAALYWNAAIVAEGLGELNEAIHMAERALAQMSESTNTRDLVRLRIAMAQLLVLSDPPRAEEAWNTLALASDQLDDLGSEMDHMRWERTAAIALVLRGVLPKARELAEAAVSRATEGAEDQAVSLTTLGDVHLAEGDAVEGLERYRAAAELLHRAPPNRATARAWRDLGDRFTTLDHPDEAASCFAEALVIVGLPDRSAVLRSARSRTARPSKTLQG